MASAKANATAGASGRGGLLGRAPGALSSLFDQRIARVGIISELQKLLVILESCGLQPSALLRAGQPVIKLREVMECGCIGEHQVRGFTEAVLASFEFG